ncbi:2-C-methyl-D-erythritol 4-phosphate cytidylyltransferase [Psychrobacter aestuarii]|uniref:2-C-methyl-D-erythritol 4-phosphate cytidylyltransferase n=1 Tax=Psychrobacter aestuarii TaxID=556327 RepID=A0ABN0VLW0_9GAMM|nr:2-C-methyl-D-erythritol 4-phosphate cytidylyltransferase [Psychrobacter aestuarii]
MSSTPTLYPMIVAAGRGSRFGAQIPKQYTQLLGKTLLEHSIAALAQSAAIHECLIVISKEDTTAQTLDFALPVRYTTGGAERWQSVQAGLTHIIEAGAAPDDLVLIHDAARPAVSPQDIEAVIDAAHKERYGAILAAPVADTLKQSLTGTPAYIERTIERSQLWQAYTPQVFRIGALQTALDYVAKTGAHITDEASAFESMGLPIRLVSGSRQNIKLTYPEDADLLSAILTTRR